MNRFLASALLTALTIPALAQTTPSDTTAATAQRQAHWLRTASDDISISLGFNALTGKDAPTLKPLGSRYLALGYLTRFRLSEGSRAGLALRTGLEVSWNNFMLDDNRVAMQTPGGVAFPDAARTLDKSKLTVAYLNLPIMPTVVFRRGAVRSVSAGGYVGMRLDSYTKVKEENGHKNRDHGRYALNNFRYGVGAEINFRHAPTFFAQYDLNPLFRAGQGPATQGLSFGIRL